MKRSKWLFIAVGILLLITLVDVSPLASQDEVGDPEANKALLLAFFEAEADREYDRMGEFFVEDFVRHSVATTAIMPGFEVTSLEQYVGFLQETAAMFPDYANTPQMLAAEGDNVAFYAIFSGTFAENGNHIEVPITGFARFEGGKVAELWVEWDNMTWNAQMMAEPAQPLVAADLVGTWRWQYDEFYFQFRDDGTFRADESRDNLDSDTVQDIGTFQVEGGVLTLTSAATSRYCNEGDVGEYEVSITDSGELQLVLQQDGCAMRRAPSTNPQPFDRVE